MKRDTKKPEKKSDTQTRFPPASEKEAKDIQSRQWIDHASIYAT